MSDGDLTPKKQGLRAAWEPGRSGNPAGRPRGSRNKLSEEFLAELHASFQEHGAAVIERVMNEDPVAYVRLIASLVPKQFKVDDADDQYANMTDEEIMDRIRQRIAELDLQLVAADDFRKMEFPCRSLPDKSGDEE